MQSVLVRSLLLASTGLLSLGALMLALFLLLSEHGWRTGLAYALGYSLSYFLLGAGVLLFDAQRPDRTAESAAWTPWLLLALALLMFWSAWRNARKPPAATPPWLARLYGLSPRGAFGFGVLVTLTNVKNLALFLSALSVIALSQLPLSRRLLLLIPLTLLFCLVVLIPPLLYLAFPRRAARWLGGMKQALETHSRSVEIGLPLFFGFFFLFRSWQAFS